MHIFCIIAKAKNTVIQGGIKMTSKELLYVEDALGHEQYFQTQFKEISDQIQDGELKDFSKQCADKHKEIFGKFYNLL